MRDNIVHLAVDILTFNIRKLDRDQINDLCILIHYKDWKQILEFLIKSNHKMKE